MQSSALPPPTPTQSNGDTIKVVREEGRKKTEVKIRLDGIDAPESTQPFGTRSKQFASDMVFGKTVTIKPKETDRYGRMIGIVRLGDSSGPSLNLASVKAGMAWWYRQYSPKAIDLKSAEAEARAAKLGIWSEPNAVAP